LTGCDEKTSDLRLFVDRLAELFDGPSGLLAARAAVLAAPTDEEARTQFQAKDAALIEAVDALASWIAEQIDPLDLAVLKTNARMKSIKRPSLLLA
jgi:hypothetical protein